MTPWTRARQALLCSIASRSWVKLMLVASMTLSNHLVLCCPLLLLPSHFLQHQGHTYMYVNIINSVGLFYLGVMVGHLALQPSPPSW